MLYTNFLIFLKVFLDYWVKWHSLIRNWNYIIPTVLEKEHTWSCLAFHPSLLLILGVLFSCLHFHPWALHIEFQQHVIYFLKIQLLSLLQQHFWISLSLFLILLFLNSDFSYHLLDLQLLTEVRWLVAGALEPIQINIIT